MKEQLFSFSMIPFLNRNDEKWPIFAKMNVHAEDVEKMIVEDRPWVSKEKLDNKVGHKAKLPTGSEAEGTKKKV